MVKRCQWGLCNSDSRYPERLEGGVQFVPFPKPKKRLEECKRWIKACGRPYNELNPDIIDGNYQIYVCTKHFPDGRPTERFPDPLPAVKIGQDVWDFPKHKKRASSKPPRGKKKTLISPTSLKEKTERNQAPSSATADSREEHSHTQHSTADSHADLLALEAENKLLKQKLAIKTLKIQELEKTASITQNSDLPETSGSSPDAQPFHQPSATGTSPSQCGPSEHGPVHFDPKHHGIKQGRFGHKGKQASPVFHNAVTFVNKIKDRFADGPEIYKAFLAILHEFQREQINIQQGKGSVPPSRRDEWESEVFSKVANLFYDQEDLLIEFTQFLPSLFGGNSSQSEGMTELNQNQPPASQDGGQPIVKEPCSGQSETGFLVAESRECEVDINSGDSNIGADTGQECNDLFNLKFVKTESGGVQCIKCLQEFEQISELDKHLEYCTDEDNSFPDVCEDITYGGGYIEVKVEVDRESESGSVINHSKSEKFSTHNSIEDTFSTSNSCNFVQGLDNLERFQGGNHSFNSSLQVDSCKSSVAVNDDAAVGGFNERHKSDENYKQHKSQVTATSSDNSMIEATLKTEGPDVNVSYAVISSVNNASGFSSGHTEAAFCDSSKFEKVNSLLAIQNNVILTGVYCNQVLNGGLVNTTVFSDKTMMDRGSVGIRLPGGSSVTTCQKAVFSDKAAMEGCFVGSRLPGGSNGTAIAGMEMIVPGQRGQKRKSEMDASHCDESQSRVVDGCGVEVKTANGSKTSMTCCSTVPVSKLSAETNSIVNKFRPLLPKVGTSKQRSQYHDCIFKGCMLYFDKKDELGQFKQHLQRELSQLFIPENKCMNGITYKDLKNGLKERNIFWPIFKCKYPKCEYISLYRNEVKRHWRATHFCSV